MKKNSKRRAGGQFAAAPLLDRTAMETNSLNPNPPAGLVCHVRDMHMLKDQLNRVLEVVNGVLNTVSPRTTARELRDCELEVTKLGLNILKLKLKSLDSLCVGHNGGTMVMRSNEKNTRRRRKPTKKTGA